MLSSPLGFKSPVTTVSSRTCKCKRLVSHSSLAQFRLRPILCSFHNDHHNIIDKPSRPNKTNLFGPISISPVQVSPKRRQRTLLNGCEERKGLSQAGSSQQMLVLCGLGYWVQGFRCFPWLALNFYMAHNLNLSPSTLQLVQNSGNLPMVAKPLYGVLSDAVYIGGAHRIPYILIGVLLQVGSWGPLALIPVARGALPALMGCILLSNLGASITEVAKDALVAEYGQKQRIGCLQSYAFMASATGGILGNLLGGLSLAAVPPKTIFLAFAVLLSLQFAISSAAREDSLGLSPDHHLSRKPILENIKIQLNGLKMALSEDRISLPLSWIVTSVAMVPLLSGSIFCYQTQCLHLDPSIIGMSRVISQSVLLSLTVLYDRFLKEIPMRQLVGTVQILYAFSLLLDFVLVRQINLRLGISNEVFALCFSGLAETFAQFKLLPFSVLLASLCPQGFEGSLTSFMASALCLSSIVSGFLGVGLASLMGITAENYSGLPVGILMQFVAALLPLRWILHVPTSPLTVDKERKRGMSKRTRKYRRVGRAALTNIYVYRRERDFGGR